MNNLVLDDDTSRKSYAYFSKVGNRLILVCRHNNDKDLYSAEINKKELVRWLKSVFGKTL